MPYAKGKKPGVPISTPDRPSYDALLAFYKEVANVVVDHDILWTKQNNNTDDDDCAAIYASRIGVLLEKVDKNWYFNTDQPS